MRYKTILLIITVQCLCITNAFPQYVARKESIKFKLLKREENILEVKNKDAIKDYNLIYLNRGTSDGVFLNNHYKFYYAGGYLARGVCIDSDLFRSIWLTYNSYGLNKIELQAQLSGRRVDNYLIPKRVQNIYSILDNQMDDIRYRMAEGDTPEEYIQRMSYKRKLDNLDEETIQIVDENEKFDLNPDIEIDIVSGEEEESGDLLDISISASPISFNRIPKTKDIGYSFSVSCADCGDKELSFSYSYDHTTELPSRSEYDEEDPAILTSSNYSASISFDWNKIYGPITFWMFLSWSRSRTSDVVGGENVYNPSYLYTGIPFGLKWDIYESDKVADLSLSWGPQMDFERIQYIDYDDDFNEIIVTEENQKFRHSMRFKLVYYITDNLYISNVAWYKPFHDFANKEFNWRDSGPFENSFSASYTTSNNISFSYSNYVVWDYLTKEREGIPSTNMNHSFEVSYSFGL